MRRSRASDRTVLVYTRQMTRRTSILIDDTLLEKAQKALGTSGLKNTVDKAFHEAIRAHLRLRLSDRIQSGEGIDRSPALLEESRPIR